MKKKVLTTSVHVQDDPSRKSMNIDRINSLGWEYQCSSEAGLIKSYQWFVDNKNKFRS
jgi:GDP-L-fucose synthase